MHAHAAVRLVDHLNMPVVRLSNEIISRFDDFAVTLNFVGIQLEAPFLFIDELFDLFHWPRLRYSRSLSTLNATP